MPNFNTGLRAAHLKLWLHKKFNTNKIPCLIPFFPKISCKGTIPLFVCVWLATVFHCQTVEGYVSLQSNNRATADSHSLHCLSSLGILLPQVQGYSLIRCPLEARSALIENSSIYTPACMKGLWEWGVCEGVKTSLSNDNSLQKIDLRKQKGKVIPRTGPVNLTSLQVHSIIHWKFMAQAVTVAFTLRGENIDVYRRGVTHWGSTVCTNLTLFTTLLKMCTSAL